MSWQKCGRTPAISTGCTANSRGRRARRSRCFARRCWREFGLPCNAPPWGTVAAVDLFSGRKVWDVPLGSFIPGMNTGTITLGGPMVTAGGLVFTAAALDNYLRAFDVETGKELWKYELPAGGQATPMTYTLKGKQFL